MRCRAVRRAVVVVLVLAALAGCKVEGRVDISVHDDGSGIVTVGVGLDDEALERLGDPATALRTDDLRAAGWRVEDPERAGARTWVRASAAFRSPGDLQRVLGQVGLFEGWRVRVTDGFGSVTWDLRGTITERTGLEQFSDTALASTLDGLPLGMTREEQDAAVAQLGSVPVEVAVHLPGSTDDTTSYTVDVARPAAARPVHVTSTRADGGATRWFVVAGILAAGAAALAVGGQLAVTRRRYGRRP